MNLLDTRVKLGIDKQNTVKVVFMGLKIVFEVFGLQVLLLRVMLALKLHQVGRRSVSSGVSAEVEIFHVRTGTLHIFFNFIPEFLVFIESVPDTIGGAR